MIVSYCIDSGHMPALVKEWTKHDCDNLRLSATSVRRLLLFEV